MPSPTNAKPSDLPKLSGFLQNIGSYSGEQMILGAGILYHYTNLDGLLGILKDNDLRLTNTRYCNDDAEMTHGLDLARVMIEQKRGDADPKRAQYIEELAALFKDEEVDSVYISCFCKEPDLLSQWRGYADSGAGVSLSFEVGDFDYITGADCHFGLMRFWPVFYPKQTQEKIIAKAIDYYPEFEKAASPSEWAQWTAEAIRFFIPTFKHLDFKEEKEYRLIFTPAPGSPVLPSYRVGRGMLIPYYSLKALATAAGQANPRLPLRAVRIGPSRYKKLNLDSARMLLDQYGYTDVPVTPCDTPFRG
jgi:hypothetical protein